MVRIVLLCAALALAGCTTTTGCYTDSEFYYSQAGVDYSCREPAAYFGGNCQPEESWPDKAKSQCRLQAIRP